MSNFKKIKAILNECPILPIQPIELTVEKLIKSGVTVKGNDDEWISVNDNLPDVSAQKYESGEYLVMIEYAKVPTVLYFDGEVWRDGDNVEYKVTHWKPLPLPPKNR